MLTGSNEEKRGAIPSSYVVYLEDDDFTTLRTMLDDIESRYHIDTLHGRDRFFCQQVIYGIYFNYGYHYCVEYDDINQFDDIPEDVISGALDDFENDFWESVEYAVIDVNGMLAKQSYDVSIEDLTNDLLETFGDDIKLIVRRYMIPEIRQIMVPFTNSDGSYCGHYMPFMRSVRLNRDGFLYWEM